MNLGRLRARWSIWRLVTRLLGLGPVRLERGLVANRRQNSAVSKSLTPSAVLPIIVVTLASLATYDGIVATMDCLAGRLGARGALTWIPSPEVTGSDID